MRSRKVLLGLACLAANTLLLSSTAHADRRTGLGGNLLIEDKDDLFPFPQYTVKYRNMISADYGAAGNSGNGVLTLGNEDVGYGLSLHRGDILTPDVVGFNSELAWLNGVQNPFTLGNFNGNASGTPVAPATFIDFIYGRTLSAESMFGARIGFGRGADVVSNDGDVTGSGTTFITLQGGYSMLPPEGLRLDLSGNVSLGLGSRRIAGDSEDSNFLLRLGVLARGYYPINDVVDIGFLGQLAARNEMATLAEQTGAGTDAGRFDMNLMAGVGPSINLERAKVAAYAGLMVGFGRDEPNGDVDDNETMRIAFAVPTTRMSAEVQLLDWLYVRTGLDYLWNLSSSAVGDPTVANRTASGAFQWNAGLGLAKDNFSFDGVVTNGFVTGGPNFIGGTAPGFLAMASLTYRFGDVFSGEGTAPAQEEQVVEPAPAPAPAPEPEPAAEETAPSVETGAEGSIEADDTSVEAGGSLGGSIGN